MKKIFFALVALMCSMSMNAQLMKVMKGNTVVATYTAEQADNVVFEDNTFAFTSVSNDGVNGDVTQTVVASENGVMYTFLVEATGKSLSKSTAKPTLTVAENTSLNFGEANIIAYMAETAYIRFMTPQQQYFTQPGTYVLTIPEGTFVDENNTPNATTVMRWVILPPNKY